MLLIRESKFGKSRLVPLHPSSMTALEGYAQLRDQLFAQAITRFRDTKYGGAKLDKATAQTPVDEVLALLRLDPKFIRLNDAIMSSGTSWPVVTSPSPTVQSANADALRRRNGARRSAARKRSRGA